ncbi:hypothetical protein L210DRAFT_3486398 [Boletus edulis BED1]|uniref:Uncharacterized protein n=1 Tax=Boletus edulis BED1 TaxID=1328754 RepID=A0AAD4BL50_BOLED|nr:hypothetical protein L210DRAFT_3486398 [Boletus edulis BED1]
MASNLLWAHLLRKDATTTDSPSQIPPIAPQDKTGTSMRMLIHDTQVNLEKFSTRLDGLLQRVDCCRDQVVNANKLLDVERDKVLTEILEIAHRCQSEVKTHVGTPAQASALDLVHVSQVSTEKSVQALEKRIDALQTLLQTHLHAMQSIQDQQNTLIGAVIPLVPILHGVSPQVDQIKAAFSDMVANAVSTLTKSIENVRSTLVAEFSHEDRLGQSSTRVGSSTKSISNSRRRRLDASVPQEITAPVSSPLDSRGSRGGLRPSLKRARVEGTTHHAGDIQLPRKLSRLTVPLTGPGDPPLLLQTPKTPRRPLADLLIVPGSNTSGIQRHGRMNSASRGYTRLRETLLAASGPLTNPPPISRPFLQPLEPGSQDPMSARRRSAGSHDLPLVVDQSTTGLPNTAGPPDQDVLSKEIKIEEILVPNLTDVISIHSSPLSSPPSSLPAVICHDLNETITRVAQPSTHRHSRSRDNVPNTPPVELVHLPPPSSLNPDASPPKSMSLRDRRAQMFRIGRRETRPFLSLGSWSEEDE